MCYLFVNENGAKINCRENYVAVSLHEEVMKKIPIENLEAIYLFSTVQITSQCVAECLKRGISLSYFSKGGIYSGRLHSTTHVNVHRQRKQASLANTEFSLSWSKHIIQGKIHNQEIVLKRYARSTQIQVEDLIKGMRYSIHKINQCKNISEVMGYEGSAARFYFEGLSRMVIPTFAFKGRSKRPPKDEFNAMLSLGYSLLMNEIYGRVENKGLHPYFGFLHNDKEKHPTLASDLMEEWRATKEKTGKSGGNDYEYSMCLFYV